MMPADAANAEHVAATPPPATLRPGMRVFSRGSGFDGKSWYPGHVYSARVDPNHLAHAAAGGRGGGVPLIYHVQFDDGTEDPNVPEADVACGSYYEAALRELERRRGLPPPADAACARAHDSSHPLETGTPVHCRWMDVHVPEMHGMWLPGTVHSCVRIGGGAVAANAEGGMGGPNPPRYLYHILFDNEREIRDVDQSRVLDTARTTSCTINGREQE